MLAARWVRAGWCTNLMQASGARSPASAFSSSSTSRSPSRAPSSPPRRRRRRGRRAQAVGRRATVRGASRWILEAAARAGRPLLAPAGAARATRRRSGRAERDRARPRRPRTLPRFRRCRAPRGRAVAAGAGPVGRCASASSSQSARRTIEFGSAARAGTDLSLRVSGRPWITDANPLGPRRVRQLSRAVRSSCSPARGLGRRGRSWPT